MIQQQPTVVPVVSTQQAYGVPPPLRTVEVKTTLGLGVTQLAIGSLSVILGIANAVTLHYFFSTAGSGIWGGLWVRGLYHLIHQLGKGRICKIYLSVISLTKFMLSLGLSQN